MSNVDWARGAPTRTLFVKFHQNYQNTWNRKVKFDPNYLFRFRLKVNPKYELRTFDIPKPISGSRKIKFGFGDKLNALPKFACINNNITEVNTIIELHAIIFDFNFVTLNFVTNILIMWQFEPVFFLVKIYFVITCVILNFWVLYFLLVQVQWNTKIFNKIFYSKITQTFSTCSLCSYFNEWL